MINYDIIIDTKQKILITYVHAMCVSECIMYRECTQMIREKKERRIERERALLSRTQQVYICCRRVRGCVPVVWEGVVLQVREREQHKVRVSGEVAHPENHG